MKEKVEALTPEEIELKKKKLYEEKRILLDKFGLFGGGAWVNVLHERINKQLEALGVDPNS